MDDMVLQTSAVIIGEDPVVILLGYVVEQINPYPCPRHYKLRTIDSGVSASIFRPLLWVSISNAPYSRT